MSDILYNNNPIANNGSRKRVVALAPYPRGWSNVELVKDCGVIPYLLYRNHGCDVSMVGSKGDTYPYLDTYVKGMKMDFLADGSEETKLNYLQKEAAHIDCLILRGCYSTNFNAARVYKSQNPLGRIYVGLDANSHWMDTILWDHPDFTEFMNHCDVIATSCRTMQDHLNQKWPWKIEYIPNGYYDFCQTDEPFPRFEDKQNIILTVARLGSFQKLTPVLVEAFAAIAWEIPDWSLRLVGTTTPDFEKYMDEFYKRYPELRERVYCTGSIQDRAVLRQEYLQAKVFALPSQLEGGTPNVIAEALTAGCVTAVAKFDAYAEAIDNGNCGQAAPVGDTYAFSNALHALCTAPDLEGLSAHAHQYGMTAFNMEKIVARLYEMLFGGL